MRSILINEAKAMLNLIPHSSFPPVFGSLHGEFIGINKESVTLDDFSRRLKSVKWLESCSPFIY